MALTINDGIQNSSPKPLDNKYGVFSSGTFRAYVNTTEANTIITAFNRSVGLTVLINTGSGNQEYWYQAGIADINLIPKSVNVTATAPLVNTSGTLSIQQSSGSQPGYLAAADFASFAAKLGSVASIGAGAVQVYSGTSSGVASIKTLTAGTGITLGDVSNIITITSNTYAGASTGSGAAIYNSTGVAGTVSTFNFRAINGVAGISVTQNTNDISVGLTGVATPTPATTANATPTVIATQAIPNTTAGILVVTVVALVSGTSTICSMAQRYVKYYKSGGTLTILDGPADIIPESINTLTTANWTIIVNGSNNFDVQVTGEGTNNIKWSATIQNYTNA